MIAFNQRRFAAALASFNKAVLAAPRHACALDEQTQGQDVPLHAPASAHAGAQLRVAIGSCYFSIGELEKARLAADRALQIDVSGELTPKLS